MFRGLFRWQMSQRKQKFTKNNLLVKDSLLPKWLQRKERAKYVEGDGFYSYVKPAKRALLWFVVPSLVIVYAILWFVYESYKGWGFFG